MKRFLLACLSCLLPLFVLAQEQDTTAAAVVAEPNQGAYRYVNASTLILRSGPDASTTARGKVVGASCVRLLQTYATGWSKVQVAEEIGYVKSEYLVNTQDDVTADVDWGVVEPEGSAFARVLPVVSERRASTTPVTRQGGNRLVKAGPKVYVCGNGRTEVYHSSEECAAMRRCTYQTLVMGQREAENSGLRGCMKCY